MTRFRFAISMATAMTAASISVPAFSTEPDKAILGTWKGPYAESCQAVREVRTEDFMIISRKKIEGYEGSCAISNFSQSKNGYVIEQLCEGEGETSRSKMSIKVINKNRILVDGSRSYDRCK